MTVQRQKRHPHRAVVSPSGVLSVVAVTFIWGLPLFWKAINVPSESQELLLSVCIPNTDKDGITCTPQ